MRNKITNSGWGLYQFVWVLSVLTASSLQSANAQLIKNTGLPITITSKAVFLNSMGDWVNDASSTITNHGTIITSDSWVNDGTYVNSIGGFTLNYSVVKTFTLGGSQLGKLKLNGIAGVTVGSLTISDSLTLINGVLNLSTGSDVLTLEPGVKVTGGSNSSYVNGNLTRKGSGNLLFPVGKSSNYLPITFYNVTGTLPNINISVGNSPAYVAGAGVDALISFPYAWTAATLSPLDTASFVEVQYPNSLPTASNPIVVRKTIGQSKFESLGAQSFSNAGGIAKVKSYKPGLHGLFSIATGLSANFDAASLKATDINSGGFTANWNSIVGATGYQIDVSRDNFATFVSGYDSKNILSLSEVITGLTHNTTFVFRVRAVNGLVVSPNSNIVPVTTPKLSQNITFAPLTARTSGDSPFLLTAAASSMLPISYSSSNTLVATILNNTVTLVAPGTTTITASQVGDGNYNAAADVAQTLTVAKGNQTITFGTLSPKAFGDAAFDLIATASSSLAVSYASSNTTVATISGKTVTIVGAGSTTITASQGGNANYNAASDVTQILTISKVNQTITFGTVATKTVGDPAFTLAATASSSLAVSYSTTTATKISISGSQVTLVAAGQATVKGSQAGNTSYNAAADVSQTFCINPSKPVITVSGVNTETLVLTSSSTAGNQWFLNGTAIAGATNSTLSATQEGVYKVQATVEGCVSTFSDNQAFIVTGDLPFATQSSDILLYPNPTSDWLTVSLPDVVGKKMVSIYQQDGKRADVKETMGREVIFQVGEYAQGIYLVKVVTDKSSHIVRFTKK